MKSDANTLTPKVPTAIQAIQNDGLSTAKHEDRYFRKPPEIRQQPAHRLNYLLLLLLSFSYATSVLADPPKQIVGATEVVEVQPAGLRFKARIDTGAKTSSIHAESIEVDLSGEPQGKPIAFKLINRQGQSRRVDTHIVRMITVKTSEGSEMRYAVPLTINWKNSSKTVLVTLNNRKHMQYGLLLGRNWLQGDFVVDIAINSDDHNED